MPLYSDFFITLRQPKTTQIKKLIFIVVTILASITLGFTQPCFPDGIAFSTQAQITNFHLHYPNCTEIEGYVIIQDTDITNLYGLSVLTSIEGYLIIIGNDALTSIAELNNVTSIGAYIKIEENNALTSLTGLDNMDAASIDTLEIYSNSSLSTCDVKSVCDFLSSPNGIIEIHDNADMCNSQEEVEEACLVYVKEYSANDNLIIYPNPFTTSTTIEYQLDRPSAVTLTIFNHIGEQVEVIQQNQSSGKQSIKWLPQELPPGMYYFTLQAGAQVTTGKMVLMR